MPSPIISCSQSFSPKKIDIKIFQYFLLLPSYVQDLNRMSE